MTTATSHPAASAGPNGSMVDHRPIAATTKHEESLAEKGDHHTGGLPG